MGSVRRLSRWVEAGKTAHPPATAIDIGCGWGELLLRVLEAARRLAASAWRGGALMTGGGTGTALARNAALPAISRLHGASDRVLSAISPALKPGPLVGSRRRGHPRPGTLCPQPEVHDAAGNLRPLDDLLGEGFALLATARLGPAALALGRALDARLVQLRSPRHPRSPPEGGGRPTAAGEAALIDWMGTATAVLLHPDRVVLATAAATPTGGPCGDDLAASALSCAPLITGRGPAGTIPGDLVGEIRRPT